MATVPSPRTWTVGELLTAAKLNTDLRDGLNFLLAPPFAVLRKSADQSIPSGSTTQVTWDVEDIDRDGGHSNVTNNSRYTSNTAGWYRISTICTWGSVGSDNRSLTFARNGSASFDIVANATNTLALKGNITLFLAVSDYVDVRVLQTSGVSVNIATYNTMTRLEVAWVSPA